MNRVPALRVILVLVVVMVAVEVVAEVEVEVEVKVAEVVLDCEVMKAVREHLLLPLTSPHKRVCLVMTSS